jgi:hypothetical protein
VVQVMGLLQVVVFTAASKLDTHAQSGQARENSQKQTAGEVPGGVQSVPPLVAESSQEDKAASSGSISNGNRSIDACSVFLKLPQPELSNLCSLLGCEGYFQALILISNILKVLCLISQLNMLIFFGQSIISDVTFIYLYIFFSFSYLPSYLFFFSFFFFFFLM